MQDGFLMQAIKDNDKTKPRAYLYYAKASFTIRKGYCFHQSIASEPILMLVLSMTDICG